VLCSEGRSFCAGAKLGGGSNNAPASIEPGRRTHLYEEAARLLAVEVPLIAAVQGSAIGGGFGLALMADLRVCSSTTRFVANFTALGLHPGFGMTAMLEGVVGPQQAYRIMLMSEEVDGRRAAELGLADVLVEDDGDVRAAALELAERVAALAPLAVRSVKRTVRWSTRANAGSAMDREVVEQGWLFRTADHAEALAALSAKRQPVFTAL